MFFWTIFGIVVIFPRVVSTTPLTFGAFTLMPRSPSRRPKYRFLIESRAPKTAALRFFSRSSSICFASPRSRSRSATRLAVAAFLRLNFSIAWVSTFSADWLIRTPQMIRNASTQRSEEHTSELQSRGHLVCRLLLEKKNVDAGILMGGHRLGLVHRELSTAAILAVLLAQALAGSALRDLCFTWSNPGSAGGPVCGG